MDAFLVIAGIVLVGLIIAFFIVSKFNIKGNVFGIPLKYFLLVCAVGVGIIALVVIKIVIGGKSKIIDELLLKLQITKATNDVKIIDEKIGQNKVAVEAIDKQIVGLQTDFDKNKSAIDGLMKQKQNVEKSIADMDSQQQEYHSNKTSLEEKVKSMKERLNA